MKSFDMNPDYDLTKARRGGCCVPSGKKPASLFGLIMIFWKPIDPMRRRLERAIKHW